MQAAKQKQQPAMPLVAHQHHSRSASHKFPVHLRQCLEQTEPDVPHPVACATRAYAPRAVPLVKPASTHAEAALQQRKARRAKLDVQVLHYRLLVLCTGLVLRLKVAKSARTKCEEDWRAWLHTLHPRPRCPFASSRALIHGSLSYAHGTPLELNRSELADTGSQGCLQSEFPLPLVFVPFPPTAGLIWCAQA